jgi:hypothetical protein
MVFWAGDRDLGVWKATLVIFEKKGEFLLLLTEIGHLLGPHGVNQIGLFIIRCLFQQTAFAESLLGQVILLSFLEEGLLLLGLDNKRSH